MNDEEQAFPPESPPSHPGPDPAIAPEISRRVGSILDAVEREAGRLREEAREEAGRYLDHARRRGDGLVAERQRRIAELSDELIAKSEAVVARLDDAAPVRQGFENLVRALGDAAERLAHETEVSSPDFEPPPFHGTQGEPGYPAPQQPPAAQTEPYVPPPQAPPRPPQAAPIPPAPDPSPFSAQPHPARAPSTPGWAAAPATPAPVGTPADPSPDPREIDEARMVAIQMAASGATRGGVREHLHRALGIAQATGILDEVFGAGSGEDARVPWTSGQR